jgi:catechol 2,3-dioxygenase-like lactoylglutathione lyase family enzyme
VVRGLRSAVHIALLTSPWVPAASDVFPSSEWVVLSQVTPNPQKLDHVALYVTDPDVVAARILAQLPFRIIEETDEFVLLGRDPELGKLTLFRAAEPDPREPGQLRSIGIGVPAATVERTLYLDEGLRLDLTPSDPAGEVEVDHVTLLAPDPAASARQWLELGFQPAPKGANGALRVRAGAQHVELYPGSVQQTDRPLLNHLGVLVASFDEVQRAADEEGLDVTKVVDAEHSRALFVSGPDGVELEYIEHKASFAFA